MEQTLLLVIVGLIIFIMLGTAGIIFVLIKNFDRLEKNNKDVMNRFISFHDNVYVRYSELAELERTVDNKEKQKETDEDEEDKILRASRLVTNVEDMNNG